MISLNDMVEWAFYSIRFASAFFVTFGRKEATLSLTNGGLR